MTSTLQILKDARKVIENPSNWTTGFLAKDKNGRDVAYSSKDATCFCGMGAVALVTSDDDIFPFTVTLNVLADSSEELFDLVDISEVNDQLGHTAVLEVFDHAIKTLEEDEYE